MKKSTRILSILLAVILTVSLIPAVSAETVLQSANIKIVYSMEDCGVSNGSYLYHSTNNISLEIPYETTKGFWMLDEIEFSTGTATFIQRSTSCKGIVIAPAKDNWWSIKINVPQEGLYDLKLNYSTRSNGGTADIYFGSSELTAEEIVEDASLNKGTVVFYDSGYTSSYNNEQSKIVGKVEVSAAGEYIIVVKATDKGDNGTGGSAYRQMINSFVLQGSDTAVAGVLGSVSVGENNEIKVGESVTPSISTVYDTATRSEVADTDGVTYTSDNSNVLKKNEDGTFIGKKAGTANIIASKDGWANDIVTKAEVIPALPYSEITCVYSTEISGLTGVMDNVSYSQTSGFWKFGAKHSNATVTRNANHGVQGAVAVGGWWAMEIYVPKAGAYTLKLNHSKSSDCGVTGIYFASADTKPATLVAGDELGTIKFYHSASSKSGFESTAGIVEVPKAGTYIVALKALANADGSGTVSGARARHYFKEIILDGCVGETKTYVPIISAISAPETVVVGEEATVSATAALMSDAENPANATITYAVADGDEAVATVSGNTVTGLSEGTATIIATATQNGISTSKSVDITVTAPEAEDPSVEVTDTDVSVGVLAESANGTVTSNLGSAIDSVEMGTTVTVTAEANPGYEFAYWKNSAGTVLSENATESFVVNTNSSFIAVFDEIETEASDEVDVYLYNANGMPFWSDTVTKETTFGEVKTSAFTANGNPTFAGYVFSHWSNTADKAEIASDTKLTSLTRAVAIYTASSTTYTIKVNGNVVEDELNYGEPYTVSYDGSDFVCWKLGDKIVSYESDYTFFVWRNVDLTPVTGEAEDAMPVAVLDKSGETYHLIYGVPAGYTRIEAGIIFGTQPDVTIDSTDGYKLSAVRGTGHFTATSDFAYARGYIIYKTPENQIRILYAD